MELPNPEQQQPLDTKGPEGRLVFIEQVITQLKKGLGSPLPNQPAPLSDKHYDLLMMLYTQYSAKFTNDNNKIWATGTLFIPLSLAGLLSLKDMTLFQTALLGFGSVTLVLLWVLVEESHRAFQNKSQAVTEAIERYIGLEHGAFASPKLDYPNWLDWKWFNKSIFKIKSLRWGMLGAVFFFWLLATCNKWYTLRTPLPTETCTCCKSATTP